MFEWRCWFSQDVPTSKDWHGMVTLHYIGDQKVYLVMENMGLMGISKSGPMFGDPQYLELL